MRCKWCGGKIKRSGDVWIADLSLADKSDIIHGNSLTMDAYRHLAMWCNFTQYDQESRTHEPSEVEGVIITLNKYEGRVR